MSIQEWPIPLMEMHRPIPNHPGQFTLVTEIERKAEYLDQMGEMAPLKALATRCLQNDPRLRPLTSEIAHELNIIISNNLPPFANSLEMLREVSSVSEQVGRKSDEVHCLQMQLQTLLAEQHEHESELTQSTTAAERALTEHSQALQTHIENLKAEKVTITAAKTSEVAALSEQVVALNQDISNLSCLLHAKTSAIQIQQKQLDTLKRELHIEQQQVETQNQVIANTNTGD